MPRRRSVTPQFTTQVVLEVLTRAKSMAQVCREYDLHEHVVLRWKAEFLDRAPQVVASDRAHRGARTAGRAADDGTGDHKKTSQLLRPPVNSNGREARCSPASIRSRWSAQCWTSRAVRIIIRRWRATGEQASGVLISYVGDPHWLQGLCGLVFRSYGVIPWVQYALATTGTIGVR
jgi:transposase-like protein